MIKVLALLAFLYAVAFSPDVRAADFSETFDAPSLSSSWQAAADGGYSFQQLGGRGALSKAALSPDGSVSIATTFQIVGDFIVSVDVDGRTDGPLYPGLSLRWIGTSTFAQIWFFGPQQTYRAIGAPSIGYLTQNFGQTNTKQPKFKITRVGTTLSLFVDRGEGGFNLTLTGTNSVFSGPVVAQLIAADTDSGPNGNGAGVSYFDNFLVHADTLSPVPESSTSLLLLAGLFILWARTTRNAA